MEWGDKTNGGAPEAPHVNGVERHNANELTVGVVGPHLIHCVKVANIDRGAPPLLVPPPRPGSGRGPDAAMRREALR